jgi:hypothetical protein
VKMVQWEEGGKLVLTVFKFVSKAQKIELQITNTNNRNSSQFYFSLSEHVLLKRSEGSHHCL